MIGAKARLGATVKAKEYQQYRDKLILGFWSYQKARFRQEESLFEQEPNPEKRPPVFSKLAAEWNVLTAPGATEEQRRKVLGQIPNASRHRWFRSMSSSQALVQSVFGNLRAYDSVHVLTGLLDDHGTPLFGPADLNAQDIRLEVPIDFLSERRRTSIDVLVQGNYRVAIECKLSEQEVGSCSRPKLPERDPTYQEEYCDGSYTIQKDRKERCSLSELGILYWKFIPDLFYWKSDIDFRPCPLHKPYQLVRNILAACFGPDKRLAPNSGHAVLIYDDRNPAFQLGGKGLDAFQSTYEALRYPGLLRKCSWQRLLKHMRGRSVLPWLTAELQMKYGL